MALILDAMSTEDVAVVAGIEARQHLTPWSVASFVDALRCGWHARVLREVNASTKQKILGYFVSMSTGDDEELLTIAVSPECCGQGHGRRLMQTLIDEANARGSERVFLEVRSGNSRAIRLYESLGFTMIGMRKNYYAIPSQTSSSPTSGREDALLMVRLLNGGERESIA